MRIVADENIPLLREYFGVFGEVVAVQGRQLERSQLEQAEVLLVRSVTPVNASLLAGTPVHFVGTCTIGTDHLDTSFLRESGVTYASAPGCNAGGVVQYVLTALTRLRPEWRTLKVGVVGCGNVGGRLHRTLRSLGVVSVGFDPFLQPRDDLQLVSFEEVLDCDVICVHTPLTRNGPHPTFHMIDANALRRLKPGALLLNAGRGGAVDNGALLTHLELGGDLQVVLDVWEKEPDIDPILAQRVDLGTPHIAGYSHEGRVNGSIMICRALGEYLGWPAARIEEHLQTIARATGGAGTVLEVESLEDALAQTYDLAGDHQRLQAAVTGEALLGPAFDALRKHYPERHEPSWYRARPSNAQAADARLRRELLAAGFHLAEAAQG